MINANFISPRGAWQVTPADTIVLEFERRRGQHIAMKATNGLEFMVSLPDNIMLRGGDALILEDGRLIEVIAAPEPLSEIRVGDPRDLARLAFHLGRRRLDVQIMANRIRIRQDDEIETMARELGGKIAHIEAPFDPEGAGYAGPDVVEPHVHGPECGHDHHAHGHQEHAHEEHAHEEHPHHDHEKHDHNSHDHDSHDHAHDHGHKHG